MYKRWLKHSSEVPAVRFFHRESFTALYFFRSLFSSSFSDREEKRDSRSQKKNLTGDSKEKKREREREATELQRTSAPAMDDGTSLRRLIEVRAN